MNKPKVVFAIIMGAALFMKAWWIFLPMFGFTMGYLLRGEIDRQARKPNAS